MKISELIKILEGKLQDGDKVVLFESTGKWDDDPKEINWIQDDNGAEIIFRNK